MEDGQTAACVIGFYGIRMGDGCPGRAEVLGARAAVGHRRGDVLWDMKRQSGPASYRTNGVASTGTVHHANC